MFSQWPGFLDKVEEVSFPLLEFSIQLPQSSTPFNSENAANMSALSTYMYLVYEVLILVQTDKLLFTKP